MESDSTKSDIKSIRIDWYDEDQGNWYDEVPSLLQNTDYFIDDLSPLDWLAFEIKADRAYRVVVDFLKSVDVLALYNKVDPLYEFSRGNGSPNAGASLWECLKTSRSVQAFSKRGENIDTKDYPILNDPALSSPYLTETRGDRILKRLLREEIRRMLLFINGRAYGIFYPFVQSDNLGLYDDSKPDPNATFWKRAVKNGRVRKIYPIKTPYDESDAIYGGSDTNKRREAIPIYEILSRCLFTEADDDVAVEKHKRSLETTTLVTSLYCFIANKSGTQNDPEYQYYFPDFSFATNREDANHVCSAYKQLVVNALLYGIKRVMLRKFTMGYTISEDESKLKNPKTWTFEEENEEPIRRAWLGRCFLVYSLFNKLGMQMLKPIIAMVALDTYPKMNTFRWQSNPSLLRQFKKSRDPKDWMTSQSEYEDLLDIIGRSNYVQKGEKIPLYYSDIMDFAGRMVVVYNRLIGNEIWEPSKTKWRKSRFTNSYIQDPDYAKVMSIGDWDKSEDVSKKDVSSYFKQLLRDYYEQYEAICKQMHFTFLFSLIALNADFFEWVDIKDQRFGWISHVNKIDPDNPTMIDFNCVYFNIWVAREHVDDCAIFTRPLAYFPNSWKENNIDEDEYLDEKLGLDQIAPWFTIFWYMNIKIDDFYLDFQTLSSMWYKYAAGPYKQDEIDPYPESEDGYDINTCLNEIYEVLSHFNDEIEFHRKSLSSYQDHTYFFSVVEPQVVKKDKVRERTTNYVNTFLNGLNLELTDRGLDEIAKRLSENGKTRSSWFVNNVLTGKKWCYVMKDRRLSQYSEYSNSWSEDFKNGWFYGELVDKVSEDDTS
jgi:hypothetical protein